MEPHISGLSYKQSLVYSIMTGILKHGPDQCTGGFIRSDIEEPFQCTVYESVYCVRVSSGDSYTVIFSYNVGVVRAQI